jgi:hypothetical protein
MEAVIFWKVSKSFNGIFMDVTQKEAHLMVM